MTTDRIGRLQGRERNAPGPGDLGLNLVTLRGGLEPDKLWENLALARRAGFAGAGVWIPTIERWLAGGRTMAQLGQAVRDSGLQLHELCFVGVLDEEGKVADRRKEFDWAAELGAGAVVSIYGRPQNPLERVRADWAAFVQQVEPAGVPAAFEFIGPWQRYNSPLSAWQVVEAGPGLGTIVFDTFHFWRGGCELGQLAQVPGERISLVHLNDAKDVPREQAKDADRTYVGEGVLPLRQIVGALAENGFAGPFSVEIFGEAQQGDPTEVSARAFASAAALLAKT